MHTQLYNPLLLHKQLIPNNGEAAGQTKVGELIDIVTETIANG